ncbi:prepilin-type N-terminal cleavage/methylation domain-containing protein [Deinococcus sp. KSM4-11]|uniref:prepilin-type N-terminal cleavage/methylation domain-containing protein n=1 Tax=Deinococcus sp. KSM4-11 TaxID=2568654 RepID=UPI0010A51AF2|nr:prepilin-type N-terminal cleavage/methylation domain-containing protein [Deinococcus sp. KSM4-11]THF88380.1 prepilin-type N-terminal cleavage/methylation domain-containing protein [Deinococcus sp. KSM4-11]
MRANGFTLVELLIVSVLATLILLVASQFLQSTNKVSTASVTTSGGINHVQQGANVVADDVRRALYIVAPGATPYLSTLAVGAPTTGSPAVTKAGADVLALYAGKSVGTRCTGATENYEYVVYYLTTRSNVTTGSEWSTVATDGLNTNQKVLMQFSACVNVLDPAAAVTTQETLRVVSDYLGAGSFTYTASSTMKYRRVTLTLTPQQNIVGQTVAANPVTTIATARNIY